MLEFFKDRLVRNDSSLLAGGATPPPNIDRMVLDANRVGEATRSDLARRQLEQGVYGYRWRTFFVLKCEGLRSGLHSLRWKLAFAAKLRGWRCF